MVVNRAGTLLILFEVCTPWQPENCNLIIINEPLIVNYLIEITCFVNFNNNIFETKKNILELRYFQMFTVFWDGSVIVAYIILLIIYAWQFTLATIPGNCNPSKILVSSHKTHHIYNSFWFSTISKNVLQQQIYNNQHAEFHVYNKSCVLINKVQIFTCESCEWSSSSM